MAKAKASKSTAKAATSLTEDERHKKEVRLLRVENKTYSFDSLYQAHKSGWNPDVMDEHYGGDRTSRQAEVDNYGGIGAVKKRLDDYRAESKTLRRELGIPADSTWTGPSDTKRMKRELEAHFAKQDSIIAARKKKEAARKKKKKE